MRLMEAEKSHYPLSTSWRPRKLVAQFLSKNNGLRTRGANAISSLPKSEDSRVRSTDMWWQEKMDISTQAKSRFPLPLPFVLFHSSVIRWQLPTLMRAIFFTRFTNSNALFQKHSHSQSELLLFFSYLVIP